ncbi:MBL fold metallo-hydrolase [Parvularcula sp. LCG005]|uniref:MBL fold metallo-hydrolase n=1 Tax=Parvularcula sp. LCG005 TaxID=3078805 RepID=UPI002941E3BC|nr:MBL fold metallo-hydrolase [Parvularcula sp. LCG005]WOI52179.1 MBL fold metallo-hydrolase [Parvularcula sp. LCG005]
MKLEKIKTEGLAHLSYLLTSNGEAAVIDPRRDIDVYLDPARRDGCRITHIFETHRNEDLVSGAGLLAEVTGADVWHGPNPAEPIRYAKTTREGDSYQVGDARIEVLETPGHTYDSLSFILFDQSAQDGPVGVFTGDALFVGDVGRTDFYPGKEREVSGLLYDSLQKLLKLGDHVLLYPAHGAGSVCGSGMADREFSTIGHERRNNPRLGLDRDAFIEAKLAEHHEQPPYFRLMERLNVEGASPTRRYPLPPPKPILKASAEDSQLVDVRGVVDFAGAHIPGSIAIPDDMLAAFAGWVLDPDQAIDLVCRDAAQAERSVLTLERIGYDHVESFRTGMVPVASSGAAFASLTMVGTETVRERLGTGGWMLLDVRGIDEFAAGHIEGATNIYLGHLPSRVAELPRDKSITVMCGSGARATIAASILLRNGFENVDVYLGSWKAWTSSI